MAGRSALTAALNDPDAPVADFALSGRRLPSSMREDMAATLDAVASLGSSVDARSNFLSSTPSSLPRSSLGGGSYRGVRGVRGRAGAARAT
jgi:hypothetical protein